MFGFDLCENKKKQKIFVYFLKLNELKFFNFILIFKITQFKSNYITKSYNIHFFVGLNLISNQGLLLLLLLKFFSLKIF